MRYLPFVAFTEIFMTLFLSCLILYTYDRRDSITFRQWAVVVLLLVMMSGMLQTVAYYVISAKSFLNTVVAVNLSMFEMAAVLMLLLWQYPRYGNRSGLSRSSVSIFTVLLILNEISMGVFAYALGYGYNLNSGLSSVPMMLIRVVSLGVNSYLFIIPMVAEMAVFFLFRPVHGVHRLILFSLIIMSLLAPTMLGKSPLILYSTLLILPLMSGILPIILNRALRDIRESFMVRNITMVIWIFPIILLMMSGTLFGAFSKIDFALGWAFFAFAMLLAMAYYFSFTFQASA